MTKQSAFKNITEYLKTHNIQYRTALDEGHMRITMAYDVENAPGKYIEACAWFYEDLMEARVYYSALGSEICKKSEHIDSLFRVINFINARVFLSCSDGADGSLYETHLLYTPRIYLTEDNQFDITITTMINYDVLELAPVETADYLTAYCPELLDRLSFAIFGVLLGQITSEEAITYIKNFVLSEE